MTIFDIRVTESPEQRARELALLLAPITLAEEIYPKLVEVLRAEHRRTCDRARARVELALAALQRHSDGHYNRGLEAGRHELSVLLKWLETEAGR